MVVTVGFASTSCLCNGGLPEVQRSNLELISFLRPGRSDVGDDVESTSSDRTFMGFGMLQAFRWFARMLAPEGLGNQTVISKPELG